MNRLYHNAAQASGCARRPARPTPRRLARRSFLGLGLLGLLPKTGFPIAGSFVHDAHVWGHRLRDRAQGPPVKETIRIPVVIVGGGIAGFSAAWRMEKAGFRDFVVLEAERQAGGNSRWGECEISAFPWAAHYVPVPSASARLVRELFQDLGVLREGEWDERFLCHSPQERLFLHGRWQEGIEPHLAATAEEQRQFRRFEERIAELRRSGQFTIPLEQGARPSPLDRMTMAEWMRRERLDSAYLRWYVDYACRDDYGARAAETSAWAGVHYFAAREPEEKGPLTWPEGNGWIVRQLQARLAPFVRTGSPVEAIVKEGARWRVRAAGLEYLAEAVIFAAPTFLAPYVVEGAPPPGFVYSPWLTANLTLDRLPRELRGEPAWDNVIYDSPALGYVVATHQSLRTHITRTVWTYYWALADGSPAANRAVLLARDWNSWKEAILSDLARAHPDIRACVTRLDILRLGHAMVRPTPGFLESPTRRAFVAGLPAHPGIFWANSDLSGISIFEEAQYRGVRAAEKALARISRPSRRSAPPVR
jgi:glycine/D-amino acid oxidase-like deaminating enzyme